MCGSSMGGFSTVHEMHEMLRCAALRWATVHEIKVEVRIPAVMPFDVTCNDTSDQASPIVSHWFRRRRSGDRSAGLSVSLAQRSWPSPMPFLASSWKPPLLSRGLPLALVPLHVLAIFLSRAGCGDRYFSSDDLPCPTLSCPAASCEYHVMPL